MATKSSEQSSSTWKNGKVRKMLCSSEARICHWQRALGGYFLGYPGDENVFSSVSASRRKKQSSGNEKREWDGVMSARTRSLELVGWSLHSSTLLIYVQTIQKKKKSQTKFVLEIKVWKRFNYKRHIWISLGFIHPLWCKCMQRKINVRILQLLW